MKPTANATLTMRIAAAMQMMGINGLPRNYELVYEAYAGTDQALVRAFKLLGRQPSQAELDQLGRRFLPHHFEAGSLEAHTDRVKDEMAAFVEILQMERASLAQYGQLIEETMDHLSGDQAALPVQLAGPMEALGHATRSRQERAETISRQVSEQTVKLEAVNQEIQLAEQQKFTDALTGLGNRRMFNKELASLFKQELAKPLFGVVIGEVINYDRLAERNGQGPAVLKAVASHLRAAIPSDTLACRFDGGKFGLIYRNSDRADVNRLAERALVLTTQSNTTQSVPMNMGACMSEHASDGFDIVSLAEKALRSAQDKGPNTLVFHTETASSYGAQKNYAIYEAARD